MSAHAGNMDLFGNTARTPGVQIQLDKTTWVSKDFIAKFLSELFISREFDVFECDSWFNALEYFGQYAGLSVIIKYRGTDECVLVTLLEYRGDSPQVDARRFNAWMEMNICDLLTDETSKSTRTLLIMLCADHVFRLSIGCSVDNIYECGNMLFLNCEGVIRDSLASERTMQEVCKIALKHIAGDTNL